MIKAELEIKVLSSESCDGKMLPWKFSGAVKWSKYHFNDVVHEINGIG